MSIKRITFHWETTNFICIRDHTGNRVGTLERDIAEERPIWRVRIGFPGVLLENEEDDTHNLFNLARAKQVAKKHLLRDAALEAYRLHHEDGEGASTVGIYLGVPTQAAGALIEQGRKIVENNS